jgi:GR25 family glycosyltransferase involved in LPS biosynthesis
MFSIPILLITYKRPEKAKLIIDQINLINAEKVYVFNDYQANEELKDKVSLTKSVVKKNLKAKLILEKSATQNLGCKYGPETAISWFLENEEYGIILEDDCLPSADFFKFCEEMLIRYKDDSRILQINGTNLISTFTNRLKESYYLSTVTSAWGWATWRRAWSLYNLTIPIYQQLIDEGRLNSNYRDKKIRELRKREVECVLFDNFDAWDYTWRFIVNLNGFAITPKVNLVKNIGFDEEATHTMDHTEEDVKNVEALRWPLIHPTIAYQDKWDMIFYRKGYPQLYKKTNQKTDGTIFKKGIALLKKIIRKFK